MRGAIKKNSVHNHKRILGTRPTHSTERRPFLPEPERLVRYSSHTPRPVRCESGIESTPFIIRLPSQIQM